MADNIAKFLKKLIDSKGLEYPWVSSFDTFKLALKSRLISNQDARTLFYILLGGLEFNKKVEKALNLPDDNHTVSIAALISEYCHLDEPTCNTFAEAFVQLYSPSNRKEWEAAELSGFRTFCHKKWTAHWEGQTSWSADHVYVDCDAVASFILEVSETGKIKAILQPLLTKNPFVTAEAILEYIEARLCKQLDDDFENYCCCDYYPPVVEDYKYNCESFVNSFCEENGLTASGFSFKGHTGDYEPDFI